MSMEVPLYIDILLWGLIATAGMTIILYGSQALGLSRLSMPFLFGTFMTGNRHWATVWGFLLYMLGGWLFAILYFLLFHSLGRAGAWLGLLVGILHGIFLLVVILPLLPHIHPRMATVYDGPTLKQRLQPPGFFGLNYGRRTPLTTLLGQAVYGGLLGFFYGQVI